MTHRHEKRHHRWGPQSPPDQKQQQQQQQNNTVRIEKASVNELSVHSKHSNRSYIWGSGEVLGTPQNIAPTFSITLDPQSTSPTTGNTLFSDTQGQTLGSVELTPAPSSNYNTQILSDGTGIQLLVSGDWQVTASAAYDAVLPGGVNTNLALPFNFLALQFSVQVTRNGVSSFLPVNAWSSTPLGGSVNWTQIYFHAEAKDELRIWITDSGNTSYTILPAQWSISVVRLQRNHIPPPPPPCDPCSRRPTVPCEAPPRDRECCNNPRHRRPHRR